MKYLGLKPTKADPNIARLQAEREKALQVEEEKQRKIQGDKRRALLASSLFGRRSTVTGSETGLQQTLG